MLFFDTNVLVYAVDPAEVAKRAVAVSLLGEALSAQTMTLSTQVLQEFYDVVLRKRLMTGHEAVNVLKLWAANEVVAATPDMLFRAFDLQQRLQASIWDALIIQAALDAGCTTLYTEDLQHGLRVQDLQIVNPFLQPAAVHEPEPISRQVKRAADRGSR